ncbi:tetratricopeptide repeat protein [Chryseolinea sp. T2]|uniref:tetratricopeptide repeat protein n=1 Tax=Chryseolinea sp. T2 TaxID=3129255 RepID=UPI003077EDF4
MEKFSTRKGLKIILTITMICFYDSLLCAYSSSSTTQLEQSALCSEYYDSAFNFLDSDNELALRNARASYRCAASNKDTLLIVRSGELMAKAFRRLGLVDSAEHIAEVSIVTAREMGYVNELQNLLYGIGIVYFFRAEFDKALRYNFECLDIRKRIGTELEIGNSLSNIGLIYYKLSDYKKALEYYNQARAIFRNERTPNQQYAQLLVNIALCHAYLRSFDKALEKTAESLVVCGAGCPAIVVGNVEFCRGIVSFEQRKTGSAIIHFLASYSLTKSLNEERLALDNIIFLTRLYMANDSLPKAEYYFAEAERLMKHGTPYSMEQMKVYSEFVALYERKGDFKKVADFLRRHLALKDSIYDDEVTTRLMRIEANHVEKEKNARIAMQNEKLALNDKIISRQHTINILAFTSVLFLTISVVLTVRNHRAEKKRNADLEMRVKSRTRELEELVNESQRLYSEKKIWFDKILRAVRHTTNTISGLTSLASRDAESNEKCIKLIGQEINQLLVHVNSYVSRSNAGIPNYKDQD